ncbi:MAG: hypothetical protein Q7W45_17720 [Bacteroidota bacterium]|nr:hypothetical protein [Bacteroidota bacterium]MDP3146244.1 hypothetical protein [Bacteroidota bacterium]MDP3558129.1 hypothetical protein [Bacteroidota bacterium]
MKFLKSLFAFILISLFFIFTSCGKGYEVRFTNYNTEIMDSVIIGGSDIIFSQIDIQATTEYRKINSGDRTIKCITKTKKVYTSTISIPKKEGGKRTIQIDGVNSISILED